MVIRDAMKRKDKVALARVVLSNREHVIALKPLGKGLLGTTLRYPYELRDEDDYFDDIPSPRVSKDMVDLASHILDKKASKFDPDKFKFPVPVMVPDRTAPNRREINEDEGP